MEYLREFNMVSVIVRLLLAMTAGGIIGYGRSKRRKTAGLVIYMMVSVGAAMALLLSLYQFAMLKEGAWAEVVAEIGMKYDASRFASQVISGIGFLAAGSIIVAEHQQVEGLTTATGLFASACMGIAAGAGYYECVLVSFILIRFALNVMQPLEALYKRRTRNIDLYVEFDSIEDVNRITEVINSCKASIYEIEVERSERSGELNPAAVFSLRLAKEKMSHSEMLDSLAELDCVYSVEELIA